MKHSLILTAVCATVLYTLGCSQRSQPASDSPKSFITVDPNTSGEIMGVVSFSGAVPRLPTIDMTADPMCPQKSQPAETVAVKNGKLANVFVYIKEGLPPGAFPSPTDPLVLSQKDCRYSPRMMGVMVKQPFKIVNDDQA